MASSLSVLDTAHKMIQYEEFDCPFDANQIVHFKGYAHGINFDTDGARKGAAEAILALNDATVVVWDGDHYAEDSFTRVLKDLCTHNAAVKLMAFGLKKNAEQFITSWRPTGLLPRITLCLCDDMGWEKLALAALCKTKSKKAVCLGGINTLVSEAKSAPDVKFNVINVDRKNTPKNPLFALCTDKGYPNVQLHMPGE